MLQTGFQSIPAEVQQLVEAAAAASSLLICADFGSMGKMGLLSDPAHLVAVLATALGLLGAHCILLTGSLEISSCCQPLVWLATTALVVRHLWWCLYWWHLRAASSRWPFLLI